MYHQTYATFKSYLHVFTSFFCFTYASPGADGLRSSSSERNSALSASTGTKEQLCGLQAATNTWQTLQTAACSAAESFKIIVYNKLEVAVTTIGV